MKESELRARLSKKPMTQAEFLYHSICEIGLIPNHLEPDDEPKKPEPTRREWE